MPLNIVSNLFSSKKNKAQPQKPTEFEDEEVPKAPVRKYSLSKTGRMRARQYAQHKTIHKNEDLYQGKSEEVKEHKRNKSQDLNERKKSRDEENVDKLITSLYDFTKSV